MLASSKLQKLNFNLQVKIFFGIKDDNFLEVHETN